MIEGCEKFWRIMERAKSDVSADEMREIVAQAARHHVTCLACIMQNLFRKTGKKVTVMK